MGKEKMSETRNTEWIESVEERLRWFMEEATDEEFDEEEVDTLVSLLNRLKPMKAAKQQSDEEVLAGFHEYVKRREDQERENKESSAGMPATAKTTDAEQITGKRTDHKRKKSIDYNDIRPNGIRYFFKTHKFVAAAAAILLILIVTGTSMGVANANKGNGFFYWLQKDDEGMTMLTSPEGMDEEKDFEIPEEYYHDGDVPEEYKQYIIDKEKISQLQDYELKFVTVNKGNTYCRITQWYTDSDGERNVFTGVLIYEEDVRLTRDSHLSEEVQTIETNNKIEDGVLVREKKIESENNKICFFIANRKYFVEGDIEAENLIQIAEVYRDIVLSQ